MKILRKHILVAIFHLILLAAHQELFPVKFSIIVDINLGKDDISSDPGVILGLGVHRVQHVVDRLHDVAHLLPVNDTGAVRVRQLEAPQKFFFNCSERNFDPV